jgi:hypothetical protein
VQILIRQYIDSSRREIIDVKELPPGTQPMQY